MKYQPFTDSFLNFKKAFRLVLGRLFYFMEFIIPKFNRNEVSSGVYKITFDNRHFYIGSSKNLRRRFNKWKDNIKLGNPHNELILELIPHCTVIKFEILEIVPFGIDARIQEDTYIKSNFGNLLFLNRSNDAFVSKFKRTAEQKERAKKVVQKVAQFNLLGELIEIHPSIKSVKRKMPEKKLAISMCLAGTRKTTGGFVFKRVAKDGSIIEPPNIPAK